MTLPGEVGKVATSAIDALRGNPGLLVLVLLQIVTIGVIFYAVDRNNERRQAREMLMLERCLDRTDAILKGEP